VQLAMGAPLIAKPGMTIQLPSYFASHRT